MKRVRKKSQKLCLGLYLHSFQLFCMYVHNCFDNSFFLMFCYHITFSHFAPTGILMYTIILHHMGCSSHLNLTHINSETYLLCYISSIWLRPEEYAVFCPEYNHSAAKRPHMEIGKMSGTYGKQKNTFHKYRFYPIWICIGFTLLLELIVKTLSIRHTK